MNLKKIALIVLFLAATFGFAFLLYRLFFYTPPPPVIIGPECGNAQCEEGESSVTCLADCPLGPGGLPTVGGRPTTPPVTQPGGLPTPGAVRPSPIAQGGLTEVRTVSENVFEPVMSSSGALSFYNRADGKFYRRLPDGTLVPMSDQAFPDVSQIDWSDQGDKAVLSFPDDSKVIYDFNRQKQTTIPRHWEDFSFAADGETIAAKSIGLEPENRWLITFASDGSNAQLIEPLGENADKVIVDVSPDSSVVAFSDTADPIGFGSKDYLLIGKNGENFKALRVEGFGFIPQWTPDGENLLYSSAGGSDGFQPTLWFSGAKGENIGAGRTNLGIHTWADKCTFADEATAYCAVPDYLPEGSGFERGVAAGIPDSVYRIDLRNGTTTVIGRPEQDASMKDVIVSPDGSTLYYTDESTGTLREMRLR